MTDLVRWGILGTSNHAANSIIPAINAAPSATALAVAGRDTDQTRAYAAKHNIPRAYGSYEALLADPDVDVVYVPLPNNLHKYWTIRASEAGKHVLCEKPIGLDAAEAETMVAAFRAAKLKLAEAFQWRHHPQGQRTRELAQSGAIGDVRLIDAGFSFMLTRPGNIRWDPALGGGALYDVGCYTVALARYMTGAEPLAVTAQAHWNASGVDDVVAATLEFPGGVLATIHCSFLLPLRRYYEVVGTEGTLVVNHAYNPKSDFPGGVVRLGSDREITETIELPALDSYALMVEDFCRAVLDDRDPLFPAEDAIGNMRTLDAIRAAMRSGGTVRL